MAMSAAEYDDLLELLFQIDDSGADLDAKDKRFLDEQRSRVEKYKRSVNMSEQQMAWLRDIHKRACDG